MNISSYKLLSRTRLSRNQNGYVTRSDLVNLIDHVEHRWARDNEAGHYGLYALFPTPCRAPAGGHAKRTGLKAKFSLSQQWLQSSDVQRTRCSNVYDNRWINIVAKPNEITVRQRTDALLGRGV